jgi:hypothetical protein
MVMGRMVWTYIKDLKINGITAGRVETISMALVIWYV